MQTQAVSLSAAAEASLTGATLEQLLARTGAPPVHLRAALASEFALGRVVLGEDGRYRLVPEAFPPDVLAALRSFSAPTTAELNGAPGIAAS